MKILYVKLHLSYIGLAWHCQINRGVHGERRGCRFRGL